jgi:hypothetical protein
MPKPPPFESMSANFSQMPGMSAMNDTLEFVKNMWGGGMKVPGMAMPTLSVESVDKQIADLKAVESWMTLNMNMLRGTIQALEVQSATLTTLQSMSDSVSAMVRSAGMPATPDAGIFTFPDTPPHVADKAPPETASKSESPFSFSPPTADKPPAPDSGAQSGDRASRPARTEGAADSTAPMQPFANPAAWWNLLQDQFKQAVQTAVVPDQNGNGATDSAPGKSTSKSAVKSAADKKTNGSGARAGAKAATTAASKSGKSGKSGKAKPRSGSSAGAGGSATRKRKTAP